LTVVPAMLAISEFKAIWESDNSDKKDNAVKELSFVYFMCWYKSPYRGYENTDRINKLKIDLMGDVNYNVPRRVFEAIVKYEELLLSASPSMQFLKDAHTAINKAGSFLRNVNLTDDPKGSKMAIVLKTIGSIESVIKGLAALEIKVEQEIENTGRVRGGGRLGNRERPKQLRQ